MWQQFMVTPVHNTIYTIGHSSRSWEEFVALLKNYDIRSLVDIRTLPGSRKYPHFNQENLQQELSSIGISYHHLPELGGRRKPRTDSKNTAWRNSSFKGYADHMETPEFKDGIAKLTELAAKQNVAFMCSEAVWWRCHRALVADHLKINGWEVLHIIDMKKLQEHPFTSAARAEQGNLFYN